MNVGRMRSILCLALVCAMGSPALAQKQKTFATPEEASEALIAAAR